MSQTNRLQCERLGEGRITSCQPITVSERVWQALLSLKSGNAARPDNWSAEEDAAWTLYAPLAAPEAGTVVFGQIGQSIDGRISNPAGETQKISGRNGFEHLHRCRALADVVVVGVGTVLADEPRLTVRLVDGDNPVRAVIDTKRRLEKGAAFCKQPGQFILIRKADSETRPGISEIGLATDDSGSIDPASIVSALAERGFRRILIEGGPTTIAGFLDAGALNRLHVSISPLIIGRGQSGLEPTPMSRLSDALRPDVSVYSLGTDLVLDCVLAPRPQR